MATRPFSDLDKFVLLRVEVLEVVVVVLSWIGFYITDEELPIIVDTWVRVDVLVVVARADSGSTICRVVVALAVVDT